MKLQNLVRRDRNSAVDREVERTRREYEGYRTELDRLQSSARFQDYDPDGGREFLKDQQHQSY